MQAADIRPVAPDDQTQSAFDLFLIFVGANIVATTFQVGASLAPSFPLRTVMLLIAVGSLVGAALVAALSPIGPKLRVPSIVASRAALGLRGAVIVAIVLYVSNFAWIAVNNVIAASACARVAGGAGSQSMWAIALGVLATFIVARGPRAVALADRCAVPLMLAVGVALTVACIHALRTPPAQLASPIPNPQSPIPAMSLPRGLDVVIGYQVSWILMFSDYSRYTASARRSVIAVFAALALTSVWMMPLGAVAARAAGTDDPGAMLAAVGLGRSGALLLTLATLTTNFVNIYMSSLAWKSVFPRTDDRVVIWSIGLIGTALGAVPGVWLERYTGFMLLLGGILVPVGGVLLAHYYVRPGLESWTGEGAERKIAVLYDERGPLERWALPGMVAWTAGAIAYIGAASFGGTLPALAVSMAAYVALTHWSSGR